MSTIKLHHVFAAPPERVYRAFTDPDAMVKWLPPNGFTGKVHQQDLKVGGSYKMSFTNLANGESHGFGGKYLELEPGKRFRHTDVFDDPNLPGEMVVTVEFAPAVVGTEVRITQENVPDAIPEAACYLGWRQSLNLLAQLVEADPG
ncbi:MAG: SRPBCC family protein [Hyphomicrobiales bacterium]|nr:SRPBCC family protein [Hyphomicrobiales bacterium]